MTTATLLKQCLVAFTTLLFVVPLYANNGSNPPVNGSQYSLLQNELTRYHEIAQKGGWPKIMATKKFYQKDGKDPAVVQLKERLRATGYYHSTDNSPLFTDELVQAVKQAQKAFGFTQNGVVDAALLKQLNVPVEKRIQQLEVNLQRALELPLSSEGTRLVANIPEFKLHVYEGDQHQFDMDIVVGTESNKTVTFNDEMTQVVFSPYWNVPPSIVKSEILPAMRKQRNYLRAHRYEQVGTEGGLPVIRQLPGAGNSLGKVKFLFPNSHNIYFHDTPAKSLFSIRKRTFSHGCIRLAEPQKLAEYLLRNDAIWTPEKIRKAMDSGKEQFVNLEKPVAVSITYFTAFVDRDGQLNFREDVYGHDKEMSGIVKR
jgi:murein L,D-transpeptidase YcbB/YkuD